MELPHTNAGNQFTSTATIHASLSSGDASHSTIEDDDLSLAGYSALPSIKGKSEASSQRGFPKQELSSQREFPKQEVGSLDELYTTVVPKSCRHVSQVDASSVSFNGRASQNSQVPLITKSAESVIEPTVMDDSKFKTSIILK